MIRTASVVAAALIAASTAYASGSNWSQEECVGNEAGPTPLAKSFMAQFYSVKPDAVNVTTIDVKPQFTAVLAKVDGHACRMEMSPAPTEMSVCFGWLVSSMQCDQ